MTRVAADFSGAIRKTRMLKNLPRAHKDQIRDWAFSTVTELKRSAADRQISVQVHHGKKTSQMSRGVGFSIGPGETLWQVLVGTGVAGRPSVKYALIQDVGGTTHPTVTRRMKGWAWFMFAKWGEMRYKWLALAKLGRKLNVKIPASGWFSTVMDKRERELRLMMAPDAVLRRAETMK